MIYGRKSEIAHGFSSRKYNNFISRLFNSNKKNYVNLSLILV
jgi:hypothetical protein